MKRLFSFVILCAVAVASTFARTDTDWSGLGLRLGLDVNCPTKWHSNGSSVKLYKPGGGFYFGAVYNIPLSGNFYFEPGAFMFYDTYRFHDLVLGTVDGSSEVTTSPTVKKFGLRMPLVFGYRFKLTDNISLMLSTGPEVNVGIIGKVDIDKRLDWGDGGAPGTGLFSDFGHRRHDIAWRIGAAIPVDEYYFGIDVALGMIDQRKGSARFHENRVSFSIGYNF